MSKEKVSIILKKDQLELIIMNSENKNILYILKKNCVAFNGQNTVKLIIKAKDIDAFLNELTSIFCKKGLDVNDEPNALGLQIEDIIDIFNQKKYYD